MSDNLFEKARLKRFPDWMSPQAAADTQLRKAFETIAAWLKENASRHQDRVMHAPWYFGDELELAIPTPRQEEGR